ncbi:hypothetical protein BKA70DRAFT_1417850 [Coprinopsis sp. MPI-PUGE-AT-0042]|nr:hypothetical protein BKA70DRAFT_1417850 [Coprinopsis sp. MPI-PUGE-AT-0042]
MKIPASSSIILATLAISSSSSTLAAPTGTGETSSDVDSSQSSSQPSSTMIPGMDEDGGDGVNKRDLEERGSGMVSDILAGLPVVGPLAKALLVKECPPPDSASAESFSVSDDDLARLQSAVDTVSGALNGVLPGSVGPVPLPTGAVGGIPSMAPAPLQSAVAGMAVDGSSSTQAQSSDATPTSISAPGADAEAANADEGSSDSSFLISPSTTVARAEAANETATPSSPPPSPGVPSGPPNTPAMPEATPDPDYQNPDQEDK